MENTLRTENVVCQPCNVGISDNLTSFKLIFDLKQHSNIFNACRLLIRIEQMKYLDMHFTLIRL